MSISLHILACIHKISYVCYCVESMLKLLFLCSWWQAILNSGRKQMAKTHWNCSMTLFKQQNVFFDESSTDIVTHQTCDYPKNHFFFYKISTYFYNKISHIKNLAFGKLQCWKVYNRKYRIILTLTQHILSLYSHAGNGEERRFPERK